MSIFKEYQVKHGMQKRILHQRLHEDKKKSQDNIIHVVIICMKFFLHYFTLRKDVKDLPRHPKTIRKISIPKPEENT